VGRVTSRLGSLRVDREAGVSKDGIYSFCRKPLSETGSIVERAGTGNERVFICRDCAELAIHILDSEAEREREGPQARKAESIDIASRFLDHLETLSKQRALTEVELRQKQKVEAELKKLRSGC
jgi:hypothetical protein